MAINESTAPTDNGLSRHVNSCRSSSFFSIGDFFNRVHLLHLFFPIIAIKWHPPHHWPSQLGDRSLRKKSLDPKQLHLQDQGRPIISITTNGVEATDLTAQEDLKKKPAIDAIPSRTQGGQREPLTLTPTFVPSLPKAVVQRGKFESRVVNFSIGPFWPLNQIVILDFF